MDEKLNILKKSLQSLYNEFKIDYTIYFSEVDSLYIALLDTNSENLKLVSKIIDNSISEFYLNFPDFMYSIEFKDNNSFTDITVVKNFVYNSLFNYIIDSHKNELSLSNDIQIINKVSYESFNNKPNDIKTDNSVDLYSKYETLFEISKEKISEYIQTITKLNDIETTTTISKSKDTEIATFKLYAESKKIENYYTFKKVI